jgi:septal ring factor EnvC (AmiA/AmiB activator)
MAKKAVKQAPHLRVRIEPKLIARLEKAREANGNTLTGEIVSRLEASFFLEVRMASFKEAQALIIKEMQQSIAETREKIEQDKDQLSAEFKAELEKATQENRELQEQVRQVERDIEDANQQVAIVDTLMGENAEAREAIRAVALLLANNPVASAAIKAAVEEAKQ